MHTTSIPWHWLQGAAASTATGCADELRFRTSGCGVASQGHQKELWGSDIAHAPPTVEHDAVMESDEAVLTWLEHIDRYGFSFVAGVPPTPEHTEALVRRIAHIRETHYGGFWDFTSDLAHGDTAYTDLALPAHTDTTYFTDPAGLQMFHLLSHEGDAASGGASLLVDGFFAAQRMYTEHRELYDVLRHTHFRTHSAGDAGTSVTPLHQGYTIFEHDPLTDELVLVRYNNSDRSALRLDEAHVARFYEALRRWNDILTSSSTEYWSQLQPSAALIFDNHRVLHGRSAFTGKRRLCGAYVAHDDYRSRLSVLRARFSGERGAGPGVWDDSF